ncbi:MAG: YbhB/YbcL family Raf kinase inhibitor-like protein [Anaerolineales bacterium]|nr:YbhB/YbcL family Raf kinase inhibitor-like protein [Anaerolineales bacterium]
MKRLSWTPWLITGGLLLFSSCSVEPGIPGEDYPLQMTLTSTAFKNGGRIPDPYTCEGRDISPPLEWNHVPDAARSLVLIMDDPDAPVGTWVHWVLYDLSPETGGLAEDDSGEGQQGRNDFKKTGYGGPCPPPGKDHRYYFKLYALDRKLNLGNQPQKKHLEKAMEGHILDQAQLLGTYNR